MLVIDVIILDRIDIYIILAKVINKIVVLVIGVNNGSNIDLIPIDRIVWY